MPILRAQKEDLVAKLTSELQNSRVALVFAYTALNMKANDTLRTRAFEAGAKVKMISNNLLRLILKNINRELEIPEKTLALAYGFEDEAVAAKTLVEFAKETETLEVLGGWIDGNFFDASQVETLSSLPAKVDLQAQLVGRLNGMIAGLAYSLNFPIQKLAFVVEAVRAANPSSVEPVESAPIEEVKVDAEEPKVEEKLAEVKVEGEEPLSDSDTEESTIASGKLRLLSLAESILPTIELSNKTEEPTKVVETREEEVKE